MDEFVEKLIQNIKLTNDEITKPIDVNIKRGHKRSISTEVENEIAKLILNELNNVVIFIDPTITIEKQSYRPDILVMDSANKVLLYIEVKTNMGYCRNVKPIIEKMKKANKAFANAKNLVCKFKIDNTIKKYETIRIEYDNDVKMYLLSLTEENSSPTTCYKDNFNYCNENGVEYYNLFSNWYDNLKEKDINRFIKSIKSVQYKENV